jgi:hypothetical protein
MSGDQVMARQANGPGNENCWRKMMGVGLKILGEAVVARSGLDAELEGCDCKGVGGVGNVWSMAQGGAMTHGVKKAAESGVGYLHV